jgi:hypothetical protein
VAHKSQVGEKILRFDPHYGGGEAATAQKYLSPDGRRNRWGNCKSRDNILCHRVREVGEFFNQKNLTTKTDGLLFSKGFFDRSLTSLANLILIYYF